MQLSDVRKQSSIYLQGVDLQQHRCIFRRPQLLFRGCRVDVYFLSPSFLPPERVVHSVWKHTALTWQSKSTSSAWKASRLQARSDEMSRCRDKLLMSGRATHSHSQHGNFSGLCIENKTFRLPFFFFCCTFNSLLSTLVYPPKKEPRRAELITPGRSRRRCAAREVKSEREGEATSCVCSALYCLLNWRNVHFLSLGSLLFFFLILELQYFHF